MNKERVKELITNMHISMDTKNESPTVNIYDLFELLEIVARNAINDNTDVKNLQLQSRPTHSINQGENISLADFAEKYPFISRYSLYDMIQKHPDFALFCNKDKQGAWYMNELKGLKFFMDMVENGYDGHPNVQRSAKLYVHKLQEAFSEISKQVKSDE